MNKTSLMGFVFGCSLLLAACSPAGKASAVIGREQTTAADHTESAYHKITAEEAKAMMDKGGVTVVDVRTADEYEEGHIPGAVLIPNESIGREMPEALPDKDAVLLIHCRTGKRSKAASDKLVEMGYTSIYDFGGIVDWPYETETGAVE